ncbi:MAG: hypothetical protein FOGNACKC_06269 [Anaerolineae bacterium]|nr:hypothetical protein [Anaerolineae bacterium]
MKNKLLIGLVFVSFGCGFGGVAAFRLEDNTLAALVTMLATAAIVFATLLTTLLPMAWVAVTYLKSRKAEPGQLPQYPPVVVIGQTPQPYQVERNGHESLPLPAGPREFTIIGDGDDD